MAKFQSTVRANQGAAIPGTLVEAANTYRYVRKGITEDDTCKVGGFVALNSANGKYHGAKATDAEIAGVVLFDQYYASENIDNAGIAKDTDIRIVENGVVAIELPKGTTVTANTKHVLFNKENGKISIEAIEQVADNKINTGWEVVQHGAGELPYIVFIKK